MTPQALINTFIKLIDRMRHGLQSGVTKLRKKTAPLLALFVLIAMLILSPRHAVSQTETDPAKETAPAGVFRLHIPVEPHSLDPALTTSTEGSYFFYSIMRGLYSYTNEKGLKPENAEFCRFEKPLKLVCKISKTALWSDGTHVTVEDYARAFKRLLNSDSKSVTAVELLKNIKNAIAVHGGKKPADQLGIKTEGKDKLILEFENPDPDFLYKLTSSSLTPVHTTDFGHPTEFAEKKILFNGPYKIKEWLQGKRVRLEPNPFYKKGFAGRPPVEILFIDEDQTALNLYEQGTLTFLRRLSTTYISKYKTHPDFYQIPMARFDYVGFGDELKDQPDLRAALSYSADFTELQKIYDALGMPGCPALADELLDQPRCLKFDLKKAKEHWARVSDEVKKRHPKFMFSMLGGDDVKRGRVVSGSMEKKSRIQCRSRAGRVRRDDGDLEKKSTSTFPQRHWPRTTDLPRRS